MLALAFPCFDVFFPDVLSFQLYFLQTFLLTNVPSHASLVFKVSGPTDTTTCVRRIERKVSREPAPSGISVFHCQHSQRPVLRPASSRALRFVRGRRMSEPGEKTAIRDNLIYRWETFPSLPSAPSESLTPSLISLALLSIYIAASLSLRLFNSSAPLSHTHSYSHVSSLTLPVLVRSKSIHPSRRHRLDG